MTDILSEEVSAEELKVRHNSYLRFDFDNFPNESSYCENKYTSYIKLRHNLIKK